MEEAKYGGNIIRSLDIEKEGRHDFAQNGPYAYYLYKTSEEQKLSIDGLSSFTVYILDKATGAKVTIVETGALLEVGDAVKVENSKLSLNVNGGNASLLVAGSVEPHYKQTSIEKIESARIYKVSKPWGHELWISGEHPGYCLKQIYITSGHKTSLQYHKQKQETNVLMSGSAVVHYKSDTQILNDDVKAENLGQIKITPVCAVDILPDTVHRVEASDDIVLYEASTPHLDDVVRIQDDSGRKDGRIAAEHGA